MTISCVLNSENTMAHITTEQALQIPQQLKKNGSHPGPESGSQNAVSTKKNVLTDETVTLFKQHSKPKIKQLKVENLKNELGQDTAFVKETLRSKLSEYNLNPNTPLKVSKDLYGHIEIKGSLLQSDIEKLSNDLNTHSSFKESFDRLSQQQPTLNYVDNVVKISSAYGVSNNLFNSLISEKKEFNNLNDIAHRYAALRTTAEQLNGSNQNIVENDLGFQFELNA